jgi:ubiquitin thioesterase protein OTUB1
MEENHDLLILEQQRLITEEIKLNQPLISELFDMKLLFNDYLPSSPSSLSDQSASSSSSTVFTKNNNEGFLKGINYLTKHYKSYRKIRGDGNCFYRSFLYSYLENLLLLYQSYEEEHRITAIHEQQRLLQHTKVIFNELTTLGYSEFTIEVFYDVS